MSKYILSIDQGTTSTRAFLFDKKGQIVQKAQKSLDIRYPQDGWVEQDALQIWQDVLTVCHEVIADSQDIAAIAITNQRETTVVWDRHTGQPIYKAIVWQDRRTARFCNQLKKLGHEKWIYDKTGLVIDPYFSASKIKWILEHVDGAKEKAQKGDLLFGTIDSWLIWNLSGGSAHISDATNASRTQIFNIHDQAWDDKLLNIFDIPKSMLPDVKDCAGEFCNTIIFGQPIPVTGVAGDQQAALIGQACFDKGMVKSTYGTGCFVLMNTGSQAVSSQNGLLTTVGYRLNGVTHYALEGAIFNAGTAIQWLRDDLKIIDHARETASIAQSIADNGGVYFVPAFTGLGAPYWKPSARGLITGLQRSTDKAHIIRAALEAQAYQTQDLLMAMVGDANMALKTIRLDGGMVANNFVCQFIADICNVNIDRPKNIETTVWGVAYLAGMQIGFYPKSTEINDFYQLDKSFKPSMDIQTRNQYLQGWQKAIKQCLVA